MCSPPIRAGAMWRSMPLYAVHKGDPAVGYTQPVTLLFTLPLGRNWERLILYLSFFLIKDAVIPT